MDFITFGILVKTIIMKLRFSLLLFCLLGIGVFSHAQDKKKASKPTIVNEPEDIPVSVKSTKKAHNLKPPPPPPQFDKEGKPLPPPKVEVVKFTPPKIVKDKPNLPPPPPPKKEVVKFTPPKIVKDKQAIPPPPPPVKPKTTVLQTEIPSVPPKDVRA